MVDQAKMNGQTRSAGATESRDAGHAASLASHLFELSELQLQLFAADVREASQYARRALGMMATGLGLLIAALPVLLLALAAWLKTSSTLSWPACLGLTGVVAIAMSGIVAYSGWKVLHSGASKFARSRSELQHNILELKQVVVGRSQQE